MLSLEETALDVRQAAYASFHGEDGKGKDGPLSAVGMELAVLYHQQQKAGTAGVQALRGGDRQRPKTRGGDLQSRAPAQSPSSTGRVLSPVSSDGQSVTVDAVASGDPSRLLQDLRALGLEGESSAGNVVSGRLPIAAIEEAAALPSLRGMMPAYARTTAGSVGSEADTAHSAATARSETGTDGSGQKVCALSDSYDNANGTVTATDDIQSGDLPGSGNPEGRTTPVDVLDDGASGDDEGRAMLQLIHDIAPEAALGFHTAFGGLGVFASGIRELADAGCTVIVDDVRYSTEPFYQDGPVANAIDDVAAGDGSGNGVAYFSSAGNDGQNSYEAPFRDSGEPGVIDPSSVRHDFDPGTGTDTRQEITIQSGGTFQVFSLQWTDPSALVEGSSGPDTDLDVALVDEAGTPVAQSASANVSTGVPSEFLEYTNNGSTAETLHLVIEKATGPDPDEIKYVYSGSGYAIEEYDTLGPTVYGHPMAEGAIAVAAAPFFNTAAYNPGADPATLEAFSSKGGLQIRFDQSGDRLSTPQDREKPDVTGTDGVDNTFFGSDIGDSFFDGVDADPHPNFFGTSAAAPNVAAIGALIRQARPGLAPSEVYSRLEDTAADVTSRASRDGGFVSVASGPDPWSGHGFVQAEQAVPEVANQSPVASADTFETSQDSTLTVEAPGVLKNDSDLDGDSLEASATTTPSAGELTLQPNGGFEYVPDPGFAGTDQFRYAASDPSGLSDTSEVRVEVTEAEVPRIAARIVPSDTTIDSGENLALAQTIENEATSAELEVQVTNVPSFLTLEGSAISEGSGSADSTDLTLGPEAEATLTYSFGKTADAETRFEGTISHDTNDPESPSVDLPVAVTVEPPELFKIAGTVTYPVVEGGSLAEGRALEGAVVEARSADTTATDTTGSGGSFAIEGLPAGNYEVSPLPSGPAESVSTADALRVVLGFIGEEPLTGPFQRAVADVNADGTVNVTDALQIARFDLGLIESFEAGALTSDSASVAPGDSSGLGTDLRVAETGDADLSGGEAGGSAAGLSATAQPSPSSEAAATQSIDSGSESAVTEAGETFEVPIRVGQDAEVGAYQLTIDYSLDVATFEGVETSYGGMLVNEEVLAGEGDRTGTVQVGWFARSGESALRLSGESELMRLRFKAAADVEETEFAPTVTGGEIASPAAEPVSVGVNLQAVRIGAPAPEAFALEGSSPNPTAGQTAIAMDLPAEAQVTVEVYNLLGQRVQATEQPMSAGSGQTLQLDASGLASGQYFYRVEADLDDRTTEETGRLTVVK